MAKEIKQSLEEINQISRQLLSRLLSVDKEIKESKTIVKKSELDKLKSKNSDPNKSTDEKVKQDSLITYDELTQLTEQREKLIHQLFKQNSKEDLSQEHLLLNELLSLDSDITNYSTICKKALTEQMIRFKKSQSVSKSYQKY